MNTDPKHERLSTDTPAKNPEDKLDKQLEDSFPTSDPPSHSPATTGLSKAPHDKKDSK